MRRSLVTASSLFVLLLGMISLLLGNAASSPTEQRKLFILELEGTINPGTAHYVERGLEAAQEQDVALALIRLDTPGGLASSMRTIVKAIMGSSVPVVVYVAPSGAGAASAGVLVTIAAHVAAMAPGTNIGAAHPVGVGGQEIDSTLSEKIVSDMVSYGKGIAQQRGRNAEWVERAIRESVSITAEEALQEGVIDLIAKDMDALLEDLEGLEVVLPAGPVILRTADLERVYFLPGFRDRVLELIGDPNIAYILMMIGLAGLYFELANPGAIFPGVVGAISLILAFYSLQTLPVNYAGLLLIALAFVLFIAEVQVQSYGILSIGGVISLVLGSIMLFEEMGISFQLMVPTLILVGGFFVIVAALAFRAYRATSRSGKEGILGEVGVVRVPIDPEGMVFVHGELWKARSGEKIDLGEKVRVEAMEGLVLQVSKIERTS
jgi:membrane-bound serine protease (ClpP class)